MEITRKIELLEKLELLRDGATDELLHPTGRYFNERVYRNLTSCAHGDTGEFGNQEDGKAIAILWELWREGAISSPVEREEAPEFQPEIVNLSEALNPSPPPGEERELIALEGPAPFVVVFVFSTQKMDGGIHSIQIPVWTEEAAKEAIRIPNEASHGSVVMTAFYLRTGK